CSRETDGSSNTMTLRCARPRELASSVIGATRAPPRNAISSLAWLTSRSAPSVGLARCDPARVAGGSDVRVRTSIRRRIARPTASPSLLLPHRRLAFCSLRLWRGSGQGGRRKQLLVLLRLAIAPVEPLERVVDLAACE